MAETGENIEIAPPHYRWRLAVYAALCVMGFTCSWAHAQLLAFASPYFESVSNADELPDNNVFALAQDLDGFIWIGTPNGLFRYDGHDYVRANVSAARGDLGSAFVRALLVASDGRLWIGTEANGLFALDPRSGESINFLHDDAQADSLIHNRVLSLVEDTQGFIWVGTHQGLDKIHSQARTFEHIHHPLLSSRTTVDRRILSLLLSRTGELWIATAAGLRKRHIGTGELAIAGADQGQEVLPKGAIRALLELADGKIAVAASLYGVYLIDGDGHFIRRLSIASARSDDGANMAVLAMIQPSPSELWLAGVGEIAVVSEDGARVMRQMPHDIAIGSSPPDAQINAMIRGRTGEIWIGSYSGGLQKHHPDNQSISVLRYGVGSTRALSRSNIVSVLAVDNGQIWAAARGNGVDIIDLTRGLIGGIRPSKDGPIRSGDVWINSMAQTSDRSVWLGGSSSGIVRVSPDSLAIQPLDLPPSLREVTPRSMCASVDGGLWLGTVVGLVRWQPRPDDSSAAGTFSMVNGGDMVAGDINAIVEARDRRLWVGSGSGGLYRLEPGSNALRQMRLTAEGSGTAISASVVGLLVDHEDVLWIDTAQGLYRVSSWSENSAVVVEFGASVGLAGRPLGANLLEDATGRIWTSRFVLDPKKPSVYELQRSDGADIGTPWFRAYDQSARGLLLFGGSAGLMIVDPSRFQPATATGSLQTTNISIDGVMVNKWSAPSTLTLPSDARSFRIEFAALSYSAARRVSYEHRLRNYDEGWTHKDSTRRSASYGGLAPGRYTLEVRAFNQAGVAMANEISIPVVVLAAYWQTGWFLLACIALGLLLIVAGFRSRTAVYLHRAAALEKRVHERTLELRDEILARENIEEALRSRNTDLLAANQMLAGTQNQLMQSEKMATVGVLAAGVAHEINNPIGFVKSNLSSLSAYLDDFRQVFAVYADLEQSVASEVPQLVAVRALKARVDLDYLLADVPGLMEESLGGIARVEAIVRDLKDFSHVDGAERQSVDLLLGLDRTLNIASNELKYKVEIIKEYGVLPPVSCMPFQINQVFLNLLINSAHAISGKGSITIRCGHDQQMVWLTFTDTGTGIAPEHRARIFEPFFTTKPVGSGTGLGLSVSYNIIQKHGGSIEVESEVGKGTTFTVRLPINAPAA